MNGRADMLVTHNVRHFAKGAVMFGLRVLQPGELLHWRKHREHRETASDFLKRRSGKARPEDMLPFLDKAGREAPPQGDEI